MGFMESPLTLGNILAEERRAWNFLPALVNGFSLRPPPASSPTVALQRVLRDLNCPEGSCTVVSLSWLTTMAPTPPDLANLPPSPGLASTLWTCTPTGILPSGRVLPISMGAPKPTFICWPTWMESAARTRASRFLPLSS